LGWLEQGACRLAITRHTSDKGTRILHSAFRVPHWTALQVQGVGGEGTGVAAFAAQGVKAGG
jgi:hypothetical protein